MKRKIIVGFTTNTSAAWPRFFCNLFCHCVVVIDGMLVQIGTDGIRLFRCGAREIEKLESSGWVFLECAMGYGRPRINPCQFLTCVGFAKRAIGIRSPFIWTPDQLFRFLSRNLII